MPGPKVLTIARNINPIASCNACGKQCYEAGPVKSNPEHRAWCKPSMLLDMRIGMGNFATLIKLCDACLAELGWKIAAAVSVPQARS